MSRESFAPRLSLGAGAMSISFMPVFVQLIDAGPSIIGFYRMLIGAVIIAVITASLGVRTFAGWNKTSAILWSAGAFLGLDMVFWHQSIHLIGPGLATILGNFQVFFLAAAGIIVFGERPGIFYFAGVITALIGLGLLVGIQNGFDLPEQVALGVLYGFITAIFYALHTLFMKLSMEDGRITLSPWGTMLNISTAACITFAISALVRGESFAVSGAVNVASLFALGIFGQVVGWVLIARGVKSASASVAGLILLFQPTFAFIWDILFFARPVTPFDVVGAFLALSGIYLGMRAHGKRS